MDERSHNTNHPQLQGGATQAIDLHRWTAEIEEFVSEISKELSEIADSLGESTSWASNPVVKHPEHQPSEWQAPTPDTFTESPSPNDRLQSLKQRLASRNKTEDHDTDFSQPE